MCMGVCVRERERGETYYRKMVCGLEREREREIKYVCVCLLGSRVHEMLSLFE